MKTIQELNSKWYWRLIKVFYFLIVTLVLVGSSIGIYFEMTIYNPNDIEKIRTDFSEYYGKLDNIIKKIDSLNGDYSTKNLLSIGTGNIVKTSWPLVIWWKYPNAKIEGMYKVCQYLEKEDCYVIYDINGNPYEEYIKNGVSVGVPFWKINEFSRYANALSNIQDSLIEYQEDGYGYSFISKYNSFFGTKFETERNYRGIIEYIKILGGCLGVLVGIIIFTFIIRGVLYYVILGKFNPDK